MTAVLNRLERGGRATRDRTRPTAARRRERQLGRNYFRQARQATYALSDVMRSLASRGDSYRAWCGLAESQR